MDWDICRVCLESEEQGVDLHLKVESFDEYTYLDIFNYCTRLDARFEDHFPKIICTTCSNDLFKTFQFIKKAISSDKFFKHSVETEELQFCTELDADNDDGQNVQVNESSLIEVDSMTYEEEEHIDPQEQSDFEIVSVTENNFEIVHSASPIHEDGTLIEEFEKKSEDNGETEFAIEFVSTEEITNTTRKSRSSSEGNLTVECNICGKILKRWSMKHHYERCHQKEKIHLCSACPKTFTIPSDLKIHLKTHDKERERNFVCTVCRKGFFEKQSLGVHMLRHTGVRDHQCELCEKRFTTKKSLEVHEFTHNRQSGRFVCKYCSKRFPSKADLTVHERFHTGDYPYQCEVCEKSYAVKSHYNYHMAKHKGITYKCDQCDKEFMNRGSLTAHKFKHNDRMPHECSLCKKGFDSPFKLNRHIRCHLPKVKE